MAQPYQSPKRVLVVDDDTALAELICEFLTAAGLITPAIEAQLNDRQKRIMAEVQKSGYVTSGWCRKSFNVTYDTANRDLLELARLKLLKRQGAGRASRFVIPPEAAHA